jgi:amidase
MSGDRRPRFDPAGALRVGPELLAEGAGSGPLHGCTFVAKDVFDVAGTRTGAGSPERLADVTQAGQHAWAVARCLAAGADLVGKAHTDELTYSLSGSNAHYGTPVNPAAPGRVPGGSSSGSASAVAAQLCDLALGTDTGGSVRVPASYCGLLGLRPTHGRVPMDGVVPLAPSFDTVGWFARSPAVLRAAGQALLPAVDDPAPAIESLVLIDDLFDVVDPAVAQAVTTAARSLADGHGLTLSTASLPGGTPDEWFEAFRTLQAHEAWATHGPWITQRRPRLGDGIAARFAAAATVDRAARDRAAERRAGLAAATAARFGRGTALVLPSAAGPAPPPNLPDADYDQLRGRTLRLTSVAGILGTPALSLPLAQAEGLPVGVCLLGWRDGEDALLDLAADVDADTGT